MTIDIWSDIMCPFCYIGKRKLESALAQFPHRNDVQVIWHSFQLDPSIKYQPGKNLYAYLAERKGMSMERSKQMHDQLTNTAKEEGLEYRFDKAIIANSFDAHRLIQLAKTYKLGDAAEERLFRAYFTEGQNVSDHNTLLRLGMEIGLPENIVAEMLASDSYSQAVEADIAQAEAYGIRGVPFFVIDNKYGISGAQPSAVFTDGLQQAWQEYENTIKISGINNADGAVCAPDGTCG